jgi:protein TonB
MATAAQFLEPRRSRVRRLAAAAAIVLAVHVGGAALAFVHWQEVDAADEAAGAIALELAPLPAAAPVDSPDVAHGPQMQEAELTPQASKQTMQEVTKEIPIVEQSRAPDPEVALPTPRPEVEKKPNEQEYQQEIPNQQNPQEASAAPLTTAPPKVEAQPAPPKASAVPNASTSLAQMQASWERRVINHLNRYKRYPPAARAQGTQGVVMVAFSIDHGGHLIAARVAKSSGSADLDEEGLAMLKRASPLPAPPDQVSRPRLELTLPIQFRIR